MTALETAAKAMYARNAAAASGRLPWDKATDMVKAHMVELAKAAFESVRELPAGHETLSAGSTTVEFWRRAITAILEEKA